MGYILNHAIVVTSWDRKAVERAHAKASELFPAQILTPVMGCIANDHASFAVTPDGSKEGWSASDEIDAARSEFKAWLRTMDADFVDWVEVEFGGDSPTAGITEHGDDDA